jgi:hypothetical protein
MNFQSLIKWALGIAIAAAAIGKLDDLQRWIWLAQARVIQDSRTSTWGSPHFLPRPSNSLDVPKASRSLGMQPE